MHLHQILFSSSRSRSVHRWVVFLTITAFVTTSGLTGCGNFGVDDAKMADLPPTSSDPLEVEQGIAKAQIARGEEPKPLLTSDENEALLEEMYGFERTQSDERLAEKAQRRRDERNETDEVKDKAQTKKDETQTDENKLAQQQQQRQQQGTELEEEHRRAESISSSPSPISSPPVKNESGSKAQQIAPEKPKKPDTPEKQPQPLPPAPAPAPVAEPLVFKPPVPRPSIPSPAPAPNKADASQQTQQADVSQSQPAQPESSSSSPKPKIPQPKPRPPRPRPQPQPELKPEPELKPKTQSAKSTQSPKSPVKNQRSEPETPLPVPNTIGGTPVYSTELCGRIDLAAKELEVDLSAITLEDGQLPRTLPVQELQNIKRVTQQRGLKMDPARLKKNLFICHLLPVALRMNAAVFKQRIELIRIDAKRKAGRSLTPEESRWLEQVKVEYRLPATASNEEALARVDVVPVPLLLGQAAKESGWGTSAAAGKANNIFGMHGSPKSGDKCWYTKSKVCMRAFDTISDGVRGYIRYMNTGSVDFLKRFRAARAKMRERQREDERTGRRIVPLDSVALAGTLRGYANPKQSPNYIAELQAMIAESNNLTKYDLREDVISAPQTGAETAAN